MTLLDYQVDCLAMEIINHTTETLKTKVEVRQETNDINTDYAVKKIKEFLKNQNTKNSDFEYILIPKKSENGLKQE